MFNVFLLLGIVALALHIKKYSQQMKFEKRVQDKEQAILDSTPQKIRDAYTEAVNKIDALVENKYSSYTFWVFKEAGYNPQLVLRAKIEIVVHGVGKNPLPEAVMVKDLMVSSFIRTPKELLADAIEAEKKAMETQVEIEPDVSSLETQAKAWLDTNYKLIYSITKKNTSGGTIPRNKLPTEVELMNLLCEYFTTLLGFDTAELTEDGLVLEID